MTDDDKPKRVTSTVARKTGKHARATAEAIARPPARDRDPRQRARRSSASTSRGALSCPKTDDGNDAASKGGRYTTTPPNVRPLRLPKRKIAFCAVNAQAQLRRSGRVRVAVLASER